MGWKLNRVLLDSPVLVQMWTEVKVIPNMGIIAISFHIRNMLQHRAKEAKTVFNQEPRKRTIVPAALQPNDLTFHPYFHEPGRFCLTISRTTLLEPTA